jgi:NAD(P)-dependent dehydrogenase (short-subunit alcohol dehydrogenase family)
MKYVVITGASTGIGYAAAAELARHGYHVFGNVRKPSDAERLQLALGDNFTPLIFDVTDQTAVQAAARQVETRIGAGGLAGLVNNAGIAVAGPLIRLTWDELYQQFAVNLFGLLAVTQAFLPLLGAYKFAPHPPGRIVNISSVSGRIAYPFLGPYAASKHALEGLSDSLRRELIVYGIDVIVIQPGAVRTPIWDKAEHLNPDLYSETDYNAVLAKMQKAAVARGRQGMPPEKVAGVIRLALEHPRPNARYALPESWLFGWLLPRWLPTRWFDRLVAHQLGLKRP